MNSTNLNITEFADGIKYGKYYLADYNAAVQYAFYGNRDICVESEKAHVVLVWQNDRRK